MTRIYVRSTILLVGCALLVVVSAGLLVGDDPPPDPDPGGGGGGSSWDIIWPEANFGKEDVDPIYSSGTRPDGETAVVKIKGENPNTQNWFEQDSDTQGGGGDAWEFTFVPCPRWQTFGINDYEEVHYKVALYDNTAFRHDQMFGKVMKTPDD